MSTAVDAVLVGTILTTLVVLGSSRFGSCIRVVAIQGVLLGILTIAAGEGETGVRAPALALKLTEDRARFRLTLHHPSRGSAVVVFEKGMESTGGAFAFAARGTPAAPRPLATTVNEVLGTTATTAAK